MQAARSAESSDANLYVRTLARVVGALARHAGWTLLVTGLLTVVCVIYSAKTVRINSDDAVLTSQVEPFRLDFKRFIASFPQFDETSVVVITSDSIGLAEDAVERMRAALEARDDLVASVFAPGDDAFTRDHVFLFLDVEDLDDVSVRLAEAQPALTALAADPSLRGLFNEFETSVDALADGTELPAGFARMADRISDVTEAMEAGQPRPLSWADEILQPDGRVYRVLMVQGEKDYGEAVSTARLIEGIREMADELGLVPENGVEVRLTGQVPLAHEEMVSLQRGLALAGVISLVLLSMILGLGVRSLRIIVATFATLGAGLAWSTAFAMATVGEFNAISAAFAVLLIGLGVDFALHIGLRAEEEMTQGVPVSEALERAALGVGGAVSLCTVTSAVGFLSFVPTRYHGLGDLGIIAGGGMFVTLLATFTVLPALLAVMGPSRRPPHRLSFGLDALYPLVQRRAGTVVVVAAVLGLASVLLSLRSTFDFSTLGMRDPQSESVSTLRELHAEAIVTDYSAIVLAPDMEAGEKLARELEALELVSEVRPPSYYVPDEQDIKLEVLEDTAFFLEPFLQAQSTGPSPDGAALLASLTSLRAAIAALPPDEADAADPARAAVRRLSGNLDQLAASADPAAALTRLDTLVVSDLEERMAWLRRAVNVGPVSFEDLPASMRDRLVAPDGTVQITALPRENLEDVEDLTAFAEAIASVAPRATGRPSVEVGLGDIVTSSFGLAISISLTTIVLMLLVVLRNPLDALLVTLPITLAAFLTTAVGVLIDQPFNMTNVMVVPLILGLGVDNGIHVFLRFRGDESLASAMGSSTPRAVLLSALTTLGAFSSLMISTHPGFRSIGVLLSVAVVFLIVCSLVVLPAMIEVRERFRARQNQSR
ncbi:MMPL family transporter [Myxococcota bacterium]|nr:MMPL family transporter [Myxococcota bacterium]